MQCIHIQLSVQWKASLWHLQNHAQSWKEPWPLAWRAEMLTIKPLIVLCRIKWERAVERTSVNFSINISKAWRKSWNNSFKHAYVNCLLKLVFWFKLRYVWYVWLNLTYLSELYCQCLTPSNLNKFASWVSGSWFLNLLSNQAWTASLPAQV